MDTTSPITIDDAVRLSQLRALVKAKGVRELRVRAGLSQREVAEAIGTGISTVSRWESGEHVPNREHALRYAELLERLTAAS
jgi:transcriptional regulator with XRE-family HTH domain